MRLIGAVMQLKSQSIGSAKRIVSMTNFKPLWKQPVDLPNKPVVVLSHGPYRLCLWRIPDITVNPEGNADRFSEHLNDVLSRDDKTNYLLDVLACVLSSPVHLNRILLCISSVSKVVLTIPALLRLLHMSLAGSQ